MNSLDLGMLILKILFWAFYILLPLFNILTVIMRIFSKRSIIANSGKVLFLQKNNKVNSLFLPILLIFSSLFFHYFVSKIITILIVIQGCSFLSIAILRKQYLNINGIYENGLIVDKFTFWLDVHSWKKINDETLSFLINDGNRIDFRKVINIEEVIGFLNNKKVKNVD